MATLIPKGFKPWKILYNGEIFKAFRTEKLRDHFWETSKDIYPPLYTRDFQITANDMEE